MTSVRPPGRRRRGILIALLVVIVAAALIGSKLSEGPSSYTTASVAHSRCGGSSVTVGGTAEPVLSVENTSGHDWMSSYVWISGASNFRTASVSLDDQQSTADGGGIYDLGPLLAGKIGGVHFMLAASSPGADTVHLQVWGSSSTTNDPSQPNVAPGITCAYTIKQ
jgi:hypothetical protein